MRENEVSAVPSPAGGRRSSDASPTGGGSTRELARSRRLRGVAPASETHGARNSRWRTVWATRVGRREQSGGELPTIGDGDRLRRLSVPRADALDLADDVHAVDDLA